MPVLLDPDELQSLRDELVASFPDTAHIMRATSGTASDTVVQPVAGSDSQAPISGGISDGRGGFIFTNDTTDNTPANPDPNPPVYQPGDYREVENYPCIVRSLKRGGMEMLIADRFTAKEVYVISLPVGSDVIVEDRILVTSGRDLTIVDLGTPAATGGPTFDSLQPQYEVTAIELIRSNPISLQARLEVLE